MMQKFLQITSFSNIERSRKEYDMTIGRQGYRKKLNMMDMSMSVIVLYISRYSMFYTLDCYLFHFLHSLIEGHVQSLNTVEVSYTFLS